MMSLHRTAHQPRTAGARPAAWRWAVFGLLCGMLGMLLLAAPARWLASAVQTASDGRVQLADARGTLWQGSAQLMLTGGAASRDRLALPGRLHWDWQLGPQGLGLTLQADCCMQAPSTVRLQAGLQGLSLQLQSHQSRWPASLLAGLGAPWNTLQAQGQLALSTPGLRLDLSGWQPQRLRWQLQGQAALNAQAMASRLSPLRPMGSYRMTLTGHGAQQPPTLELVTVEGALRLAGQGQWVGTRLRFTGEASAAPGHEAALDNLLNIIGRRQGTRSLLSWG
jgi:general secretion pathway protein N